jgi:(p)ppGpp synthase/HD superfamily hydrolase
MGVAQRVPTPAGGQPQAKAALEYATKLHSGQLRTADGAPFIAHPREVANLLHVAGAPDDVVAAGALHDVIEKTPATAFDLRRRFGSKIAALVVAVSEDEHIHRYAARKAALREQLASAGDDALMLFAADKISKVRELRDPPPRFALRARKDRRRRLAHYRRSLTLLRERLPDSPLVQQLGVELAELSANGAAPPTNGGRASSQPAG